MTGTADSPDVRDLGELHLRRFVAARKIGDHAAMREHWNMLVTINFPRIESFVRLEARDRLNAEEKKDATQDACARILRGLFGNFRGSTMGEWVKAVKKAVHYACVDTQQREARAHRKTGSYDDSSIGDDGEERGRYTKDLYRDAERRRAEEEEEFLDRDELAAYGELLDEILPKLSPKLRAVAEMDRVGASTERMLGELGITPDTLYQRRRRYLKDLDKLREQYPS